MDGRHAPYALPAWPAAERTPGEDQSPGNDPTHCYVETNPCQRNKIWRAVHLPVGHSLFAGLEEPDERSAAVDIGPALGGLVEFRDTGRLQVARQDGVDVGRQEDELAETDVAEQQQRRRRPKGGNRDDWRRDWWCLEDEKLKVSSLLDLGPDGDVLHQNPRPSRPDCVGRVKP